MDVIDKVPFKVGQLAESRSFQKGYRGAWFRCKITGISKRKGKIMCSVDFFDYPDDKSKWTQFYQKNIWEDRKIELMFRPSYPRLYRESEVFPQAPSNSIVLVQDVWKAGDLVDWLCNGCYWAGTVTKILGDDKVQVELLQLPMGEGETYEAASKDLRPSLDWSPGHGWVVPSSKESEGCHFCARIVQPCKEDQERTNEYNLLDKSTLTLLPMESSSSNKSAASVLPSKVVEKTDNLLLEDNQGYASFQMPSPNSSNEPCSMLLPPRGYPRSLKKVPKDSLDTTEDAMDIDHIVEDIQGIASCQSPSPNSVNILHNLLLPPSGQPHSSEDTLKGRLGGTEHTVGSCSLLLPSEHAQSTTIVVSEQIPGSRDGRKADINYLSEASSSHGEVKHIFGSMNKKSSRKDRCNYEASPKRMRINRYGHPSSVVPDDSIESSIMELEELANKIRWLKRLSKFGFKWSNAVKPSWKLALGPHEK